MALCAHMKRIEWVHDETLHRAKLLLKRLKSLAFDHPVRYITLKRADRVFWRFRDFPVQQRRRAESSEVKI